MTVEPLLSVEVVHDPVGTRLVVVGEIDQATAPILRSHLDRAMQTAEGTLFVDLTQVPYIDSSGLHVLLTAWSTLAARNQSLIALPSPQARRLFDVTLSGHLLSDDDVDASVGDAAPDTSSVD